MINQSVNCSFFSEREDGGTVPGLSQAARRQISHSSSGRSGRESQEFVDQAFLRSIAVGADP